MLDDVTSIRFSFLYIPPLCLSPEIIRRLEFVLASDSILNNLNLSSGKLLHFSNLCSFASTCIDDAIILISASLSSSSLSHSHCFSPKMVASISVLGL